MTRSRTIAPKYRLHKPSGQALVEIRGKRYYLGRFGTEESRAEYTRRLVELWSAPPGSVEAAATDGDPAALVDEPLTITELVVAYFDYAELHYRKHDGEPTSEVANIRQAVRPLTELYGDTPAKEFGPRKLNVVRQAMIDGRGETADQKKRRPWTRTSINRQMGRLRAVFKWAVWQELLPAGVYEALRTLPALKRNRCAAKESKKVGPVPWSDVEAVLPFLRPPVRAMVQLQLLTGARPGEVLAIRGRDLDMTGDVWVYRPDQHKTLHRGFDREIFLGPQAQEILRPFLKTALEAPLFSPREAIEALRRERSEIYRRARAERRAHVPPSRDRRIRAKLRAEPKRQPSEHYTVFSYRQAIARACKRADVLAWHPHQLRHSRATELRSKCGAEVARIILGHATLDATEIYAEADRSQAVEVMRRIG